MKKKSEHWWSDEPHFQYYTDKDQYDREGIEGYEPMTAKELDTVEKQDEYLNDPNNIIEEKFDGTRGLCYFFAQEDEGWCRLFSRRISKKTGFYVENTDSLPQIRDTDVPELAGTILDGEVFIPMQDFETSCGIMNSKYDRAIAMQEKLGFEVFHAFDILFYCGKDLRNMSLKRRKYFLHKAVEEARNPYIKEVEYHNCGAPVVQRITNDWIVKFGSDLSMQGKYPNLYKCLDTRRSYAYDYMIKLTPRAYYEYVVATGGEGVMVKPKNGKYLHKRGWEYSKIKKFLTRELVIVGYERPEREYKGKFPDFYKWDYWERTSCGGSSKYCYDLSKYSRSKREELETSGLWEPVTRNYALGLIGNLMLGVKITSSELEAISPKNRGPMIDGYMIVCICSGFTDEVREEITKHQKDYLFKVVEVKANEIFRNKGTLRHPRFLRFRPDKNPNECTWKDHIM